MRFQEYYKQWADDEISPSHELGFLLGLQIGFQAMINQSPERGKGNSERDYHRRTFELRRDGSNFFCRKLLNLLPSLINQELAKELKSFADPIREASQVGDGDRNYFFNKVRFQSNAFNAVYENFEAIITAKREAINPDCQQKFLEQK